jgi:peptidoglycan-associated lipoprotein
MKKLSYRSLILSKMALAASLALASNACTQESKKVEDVVSSVEKGGSGEDKFNVDTQTGKVNFEAEIVYFNFDDSTLTQRGIERLSALSEHMQNNKELKLQIQGHCDERGSVEYNLALGQRRSDTVKEFLLSTGIDKNRLLSVSFGEEKPAEQGSGETHWAKNRRAEFQFAGFGESDMGIKPAEHKKEKKAEILPASLKTEIK